MWPADASDTKHRQSPLQTRLALEAAYYGVDACGFSPSQIKLGPDYVVIQLRLHHSNVNRREIVGVLREAANTTIAYTLVSFWRVIPSPSPTLLFKFIYTFSGGRDIHKFTYRTQTHTRVGSALGRSVLSVDQYRDLLHGCVCSSRSSPVPILVHEEDGDDKKADDDWRVLEAAV